MQWWSSWLQHTMCCILWWQNSFAEQRQDWFSYCYSNYWSLERCGFHIQNLFEIRNSTIIYSRLLQRSCCCLRAWNSKFRLRCKSSLRGNCRERSFWYRQNYHRIKSFVVWFRRNKPSLGCEHWWLWLNNYSNWEYRSSRKLSNYAVHNLWDKLMCYCHSRLLP